MNLRVFSGIILQAFTMHLSLSLENYLLYRLAGCFVERKDKALEMYQAENSSLEGKHAVHRIAQ